MDSNAVENSSMCISVMVGYQGADVCLGRVYVRGEGEYCCWALGMMSKMEVKYIRLYTTPERIRGELETETVCLLGTQDMGAQNSGSQGLAGF